MLWALLAAAMPWGENPTNSAEYAEVLSNLVIASEPMSSVRAASFRKALEESHEAKWNWIGCVSWYSGEYSALSEPIGDLADAVIGKCQNYALSLHTANQDVLSYSRSLAEQSWGKSQDEIVADGRRLALSRISDIKTSKRP